MLNKVTKHIVDKCLINDRAAQKQLYYLTKDKLKSVAVRYCTHLEEARDVVQESYLKIFKSLDKYDETKGSFHDWATKITVNEALIMHRKKNKYKHHLDNIEVCKRADQSNVDQSSLNHLNLQDVIAILNKMKTPHRLVINLFFFEEFTYTEIAQILEIKESSARSRVSRAKTELISLWSQQNKVRL